MNINLLTIFIILNISNVVIQTIKSLCTLKCEKLTAALINAFAYGFYTIVTVYTLCDLPLAVKAIVVAMCNLIGVYAVKFMEEKMRKDKLWKVEATVQNSKFVALYNELESTKLPFNYIDIKKYVLVNVYCATQAESAQVKILLDKYSAKYFVSESKNLI